MVQRCSQALTLLTSRPIARGEVVSHLPRVVILLHLTAMYVNNPLRKAAWGNRLLPLWYGFLRVNYQPYLPPINCLIINLAIGWPSSLHSCFPSMAFICRSPPSELSDRPLIFNHAPIFSQHFLPSVIGHPYELFNGQYSFAATTVKEQHGQGQEEWSLSSSMTATFIESHIDNISPVQEGHQSTKRAIVFIKNIQIVAKNPYLTVNGVGGQLRHLHA